MPEVDLILANTIRDYMGLDDTRVWLYNQNIDLPKDDAIFVIVATESRRIVSQVHRFDPDTDEQVQSSTMYTTLNVEITSRDESAKLRNYEVALSIESVIGQRYQEDNQIRMFRNGQILDLSAVDGASALHRYQIPIIISHVETKRTAITPIDKFQPTTTEVDKNG